MNIPGKHCRQAAPHHSLPYRPLNTVLQCMTFPLCYKFSNLEWALRFDSLAGVVPEHGQHPKAGCPSSWGTQRECHRTRRKGNGKGALKDTWSLGDNVGRTTPERLLKDQTRVTSLCRQQEPLRTGHSRLLGSSGLELLLLVSIWKSETQG